MEEQFQVVPVPDHELGQDDQPQGSSEFAGFELPYKVATLIDLEQRAYINAAGSAEWLFSRAHAFCGIATDPGRFLRTNKALIESGLGELQVPVVQFHYRGIAPQEPADDASPGDTWKDHTFESRAFLVMVLSFMKNRALKATSKLKALRLVLGLAEKALSYLDLGRPLMAMATDPNGTLRSKELKISAQGLCHNWADFLMVLPGASALWKELTTRCWLNRCISSAPESATFLDIWFFMAYLYCHPKLKKLGQNLWLTFAKDLLVELVWRTGNCLQELALQLSNEALSMLPALKRKTGFVRRLADPVNKLLLLFKLKKEKQHRKRIAGTHGELGGNTNRMIVFESYLDCLLHLKALEGGFDGSRQISVCWDPSTYGGKEILMAVVYSPELDKAAYLMAQHMTQTMLSELHESLLPQAKSRKLVRLEGFKEIKGLSSALSSIGLTLADFRVPQGLFCRPLSVVEYRLTARDGTKWIQNERDGTLIPEIPQGMDLGALPILVSMSDQGPNIIGAANYLQYSSSALMFVALFDPFHRAWNDLKAALKRTSCQAWRCVLELTLVANLNYGPFGSSAWHWKKKAKLENYLATKGIHHDSWSAYQHHICKERRIQEPATMEDSEELFASLASMQSFENKGPLIKLMRWFSWFESMSWYEGELWATKMVLEDALEQKEEASEKEVDERPLGKQDHQQELRDLKKKKGTWRLAPELINSKNMAIKDIILAVGKATWKGFASRARDVVTPQHVLELNISCAYNAYWKQELVEMVENSLYDTKTMDHLMPEFQCHEKVLLWHTDLFNKLMETRSQSLVAFHCLPPNLYNHCLAPSIAVARAAYDLAMSHWRILLAAEEAGNTGEDVKPLKSMHWRLNPLVRVLFMAFEEDLIKGTLLSIHSSALRLQRVIGQHLGDSRLIENIHQHGRDLFRASKANSISNTAIMSNALRSKGPYGQCRGKPKSYRSGLEGVLQGRCGQ